MSSETPTPEDPDRATQVGLYLRSKFLRRIAHEVRGQAGVTLTAVERVVSTRENGAFLEMAKRGSLRVLRVAELLSMVAELEDGRFRVARSRDDLAYVVRTAIADAQRLHGRRDVTVRVETGDAPCWVSIDARWLSAAFVEIAINAIRYACACVRVALETGHDGVRVVFEDDGPGIPASRVDGLLERFGEREGQVGLGVSLAIANEVLAAHDGRLVIGRSELPPGRSGSPGARVIFEFDTKRTKP